MRTPRHILLQIPVSHLSEVGSATLRAERFLTERGISQPEALRLRMALAEACNNAIEHSRCGQGAELEVSIEQSCVQAVVTDHSSGFDLPENSDLPDERSERGRGLFLIRQVMDKVEYVRSPDGNRMVLTRYLPPATSRD